MNRQPRTSKTIKADLLMGKKNEKKLLTYLNSGSGGNTPKFKVFRNEFSTFDFINGNVIAELKSRRNRCNLYHDTMIGNNKMKVCDPNHKDNVAGAEYVFYFLFTDGLFRWDYGDSEYQVRKFFHKDKQYWEDYAYIPVANLRLVCPLMNSW